MKYKKFKLCALLLLGFGLTGLQAQQAVPASGGNASGSGGSVSYSVGQMVYTTNTGTNGSVAQGVQQPFEIMVIIGIEDVKSIDLLVSAYPNPANDFLILKVDDIKGHYIGSLYDINGTLLERMNITGNETRIEMSHLTASIYFLNVTEGNKEIKTFKIIKN
jgi:hypothetical protein